MSAAVCIIGAGTMGKGLTLELARRGPVKLITLRHSGTVDAIRADLRKKLERAKWCTDVDFLLGNILIYNNVAAATGSKLIVECIVEDTEAKRKLFTELKPYVCDGSFIATNTSSLSVESIFEGIFPGTHTFGLHFFNPVHAMRLVEVVRGSQTSDEAVEFARNFAASLEKEAVLVKDSPGFIVNRLLIPLLNEACKLVDEGVATVEDIDKSMVLGANHPLGPFALSDLIGNDITLNIVKVINERLPGSSKPAASLEAAVAENRLGRKSGVGFHCYKK
jgi:3-hydroxybutyryl-CoA dehydrogenase